MRLSRDHTPALRSERQRIEAAGGAVMVARGATRVVMPRKDAPDVMRVRLGTRGAGRRQPARIRRSGAAFRPRPKPPGAASSTPSLPQSHGRHGIPVGPLNPSQIRPKPNMPAPQALSVSRSLGDTEFKDAGLVVSEPEVAVVPLQRGRDAFLIAASDGLWSAVGDQQAVDEAARVLEEVSVQGLGRGRVRGCRAHTGCVRLGARQWGQNGVGTAPVRLTE